MVESILAFCFGILIWQFFEYMGHRHLFHCEQSWLPDHPTWIACHFVLNGLHHAYPQDTYRTVLPAIPMVMGAYITVWTPVRFVIPDHYEDAFIAGLMMGYMVYEQWHYFTHHG